MIRTTILLTAKMNCKLREAVKTDPAGVNFSQLLRECIADGLQRRLARQAVAAK